MYLHRVLIGIFVLAALSSPSLGAEIPASSEVASETEETLWRRVLRKYEAAKSKGSGVSKEFRDRIDDLYKQAKAAGEDVPSDVSVWLKKDIENMSRWYYAVETVSSLDPEKVDKVLDARGKDRWECFQVVRDGRRWRLFFKRRKRSYLSMVPVRRLLQAFGEDGG